MRTRAVVIKAQRPRHGIGAQQFWRAAAQDLALGVGRQVCGVADANGYLAGSQQARHQYVIDATDHQHDSRCFRAQALEQHGQQGEFDVVG
ncbi:hypothetical protein D3C78_1824190 [compost metagenome]